MSTAAKRNPRHRRTSSFDVINVAVIGCGYWGPNLIRNFTTCPTTRVVAICDQDAKRLERCQWLCPNAITVTDARYIFDDSSVDAVSIATPVCTHAPLAHAALDAGKHVLVEKPLAGSVVEAQQLVDLAERKSRILMVDHTLVYSSAVRKIKELIDCGELGDLHYFDSVRINLGLFQHDINVVWDLAPHDLSILDYLIGRLPRSLSAFGACHIDKAGELEDVAYLNLDMGGGLLASFHVNWLSPVKIRHLIIGGSRKSILYNDLDVTERIKVYDRGVTISTDLDCRTKVLIGYRTGDVWIPHLDNTEPLEMMVRHFAECIACSKRPITDGVAGLRVVRILDAAQRSIKAQGGRITL